MIETEDADDEGCSIVLAVVYGSIRSELMWPRSSGESGLNS